MVHVRFRAGENPEIKSKDYLSLFLLKEEQTAAYSAEIWKRFRRWGGIPTGATQNPKDLLSSPEIENILENSDFIYMLNQAAGDRKILAERLNISSEQLAYVTNSEPGHGLLFFNNVILPFADDFPKDTELLLPPSKSIWYSPAPWHSSMTSARKWRMAAAVQRCLAPAWVSLALSMYGLRSASATRRELMTIWTWMLPLWLWPSGWVQTRAWCPGNCSAQNRSPNAWALSIVRPWSGPSLGSKDRM